ncbi:hypothetical protein Tco_1540683 [Tanacetum coccineum]
MITYQTKLQIFSLHVERSAMTQQKRAKAFDNRSFKHACQCNTDRTSIPISRIFGRFRNMSAKNFQTNYMIRTDMLQNVIAQPRFTTDVNASVVARLPVHTSKGLTTHPEEGSPICKRFLSTKEFPNAYTKRREVPKTVVQNVCSSRNVRRRLTTGQPSLSANLSSLPTSAEQHLHTTDSLRNRCMTDTNDTITLRSTKVETTIPVIKIFDCFRKTRRFRFYSNRVITGPRYFCTNPSSTIARLKSGQDMYEQGLLAIVNVDKLAEVGGLDSLTLNSMTKEHIEPLNNRCTDRQHQTCLKQLARLMLATSRGGKTGGHGHRAKRAQAKTGAG